MISAPFVFSPLLGKEMPIFCIFLRVLLQGFTVLRADTVILRFNKFVLFFLYTKRPG